MKQLLAAASVAALLIGAVQGGLVKAEPLDAKITTTGNSAPTVFAESGDAPAASHVRNASIVRDAMTIEPPGAVAPASAADLTDAQRKASADVFTKLLMLATMAGAEPIVRLAVSGR